MILRRRVLSRRAALRGMLGGSFVSLGLPLLEPMLNSNGDALAQGAALPKRYGMFFWGGGLPWTFRHRPMAQEGNPDPRDIADPDQWTPAVTGKGFALTPLMEPLARHKGSFSVVTGLEPHTVIPSSPGGQGDGHMRGTCVTLTGDKIKTEGFDQGAHILAVNRETFDQFIAKRPEVYPEGAPYFRSLELGMSEAALHDFGPWWAISHNGPDSLNVAIRRPHTLFEHVFGQSSPGPSADPAQGPSVDVATEVNILDVVGQDLQALMPRLGARDRQRLEEHLTHVRELQRRVQLSNVECNNPATPAGLFDGEARNMAKLDAMADILVAALRCDLTRVFTIAFTTSASNMPINAAGEVNGAGAIQMHDALHAGDRPVILAATQYHMTAFALLLDKLVAERDINGDTLLDSACILGTSEYGEGYTHSNQETPVLIAGRARGALEPDFHVRDPAGNYSRAHLSVLRALGINAPTFGFNGGETSSVLPFVNG
jgi:hypothetical protein